MKWLRFNHLWAIILFLPGLLWSCEKVIVDRDQARSGLDYYPLSEGFFRTFDVYEINYNFASENDTFRYEIKERVADHFLNQQGDTTFVLEQLKRQQTDDPWQLDSTYHIRKTAFQLVALNNNIPVLKLVFPVSEGKTWDSNLLSAAVADSFKMVDVDKTYLLNDSLHNNTLTVLLRNIQDEIVRKDIRKEVYSNKIGPIYKLEQLINYCADPHCIGQGIITSGIIREMKLTSYGKE